MCCILNNAQAVRATPPFAAKKSYHELLAAHLHVHDAQRSLAQKIKLSLQVRIL